MFLKVIWESSPSFWIGTSEEFSELSKWIRKRDTQSRHLRSIGFIDLDQRAFEASSLQIRSVGLLAEPTLSFGSLYLTKVIKEYSINYK